MRKRLRRRKKQSRRVFKGIFFIKRLNKDVFKFYWTCQFLVNEKDKDFNNVKYFEGYLVVE